MSDDDALDLDGEETTDESADAGALDDPTKLRQQMEKLRKENRNLRARSRRSEIGAQYGKDVADLIPDELPIKAWEAYAEKVRATFPAQQVASTEPTTAETPIPEGRTPEEDALAKVASGQAGTPPTAGTMTVTEWLALNAENPQAAMAVSPESITEG